MLWWPRPGLLVVWGLFFGIEPDEVAVPRCPTTTPVLLAGQAVPGAAYAPCIMAVPASWDVEQTSVTDSRLTMTVSLREADGDVGSLTLRYLPAADCPPPGSEPVRPGNQPGVTVHDGEVDGLPARVQSFEGGCVVLQTDRPADVLTVVEAAVQLAPAPSSMPRGADLTGGWASTLTAGS